MTPSVHGPSTEYSTSTINCSGWSLSENIPCWRFRYENLHPLEGWGNCFFSGRSRFYMIQRRRHGSGIRSSSLGNASSAHFYLLVKYTMVQLNHSVFKPKTHGTYSRMSRTFEFGLPVCQPSRALTRVTLELRICSDCFDFLHLPLR